MNTSSVTQDMALDILFTLRSLRKMPAFTATALLTLILGMGATTAIFSVVYAVLFRSLPYPNAARLVHIVADDPADPRSGVPYALFDTLRQQTRVFEDVAIYYRNTGWSRVTVGRPAEPETLQAGFTSARFFRVLGMQAAMGRVFEEREVSHAEPVAVISSALWKRIFAGRADVLGQVLEVDSKPFTVVGVMPAEFHFPALETELWLPITTNRYWAEPRAPGDGHARGFFMRWNLVARLRSGQSGELAQNELNALTAGLAARDAAWNMGLPVKVLPLSIEVGSRARLALLTLLGAVLTVLLIASTNVANLLLARGAARSKELAIRTALGASRWRIGRQVLLESLLLMCVATAAALLLARWTIPLLVRWAPADLPRLSEASVDGPAFGFATATSLLTAVLFGLWPAFRSGAAGSNRGNRRAGRLLIVTEFALAVVLATSAGLLLRSLWETENVDLGFRPARILSMHVPPSRDWPLSRQTAFVEQLQIRLQSLPGVENVGAIKGLFELGTAPLNSLRAVEGEPSETERGRPLTWTTVSGEYFQAMGIPLLAGRFFSDQDRGGAMLAAIVDESMARRYWPNQSPIGRRFKGQDRRGTNDDWITVIGVVRNARRQGVEQETTPHVYLWHRQAEPTSDWVLRTTLQPAALASAVRAAVRQIEPGAVIANLMPMDQQIELQTTERRFQTWLLAIFAALALLLAAVGIFGVMSHAAARRTHEIGIRMALGADRTRVIGLFLREGFGLATVGLGLGMVIAMAVTQVLAGLLYGVTPTDPATFASAAMVLLAVAAIATLGPAWRASRVDPMVALRRE